MLRAVLSSSKVSQKTSSTAVAPPPPLPSLPHSLLGGACLLLAARRDRAALYPSDVAAALAVDPLRLTRAAAAVAEAARASEGSAVAVRAEAFLGRELPGLVRGGSSLVTNGGKNGAASSGFSSSDSNSSSFSSPAQILEDAVTLARWVESGACPVKTPAHGPMLAAGASVLAAAGRGIRLGEESFVAATFRLASAADVSRSEAALRKGLCLLAASRLPWLKQIRVKDVEGHARALLAAAREAAAEAVAAEERWRRKRQEEEEGEVRLRAATAAAAEAANQGGNNDDDAAALAAAAAAAASAAAKAPAVGSTKEADHEREEEDEDDELDVIQEEDWGLYLRRPEEVALAAVELAAREKREAEELEESGVATPVQQRPRKRACFVK